MLRRSFLKGMSALFIAPAIIRAESLMPIKEYMPSVPAWCPNGWLPMDGREIKKKFYPDLFAMYEKCRFPQQLANFNTEYAMPLDYEDSRLGTNTNIRYSEKRIVSYTNLKRSNGQPMLAGAVHSVFVPQEMQNGR